MRRKKYGSFTGRSIRIKREWFAVSIKPGSVFFLLFVLGVIFANLMGNAVGKDLGVMSGYFMDKYVYAEIQGRELFLYLFYERFCELLGVVILGIGIYGMLVLNVYIGYLGFSFGFLSVVSIMNYGAKGVLLMIGFLFPQYICYIPGILLLYYAMGTWKGKGGGYKVTERGRYGNVYFLSVFFVVCGIFFFGILSESYINPYFLQKIIRNL